MNANNAKRSLLRSLCILFGVYLVINVIFIGTNKPVGVIKNILLWNPFFDVPDYYFGLGDKVFSDKKCKVSNCYITNNRNELSIEDIDAIVFHAPEYKFIRDGFPKYRTPSQVYIFFSMESPLNRPTSAEFNGFFNWTITPRIDSDIQIPYFQFIDMDNNMIAPALEPRWNLTRNLNLEKYLPIHKRKTLPAAWFSSNCHSKSQRENFVRDLQKHIQIDIYGECGPLKCPRNNDSCFDKIKQNYYFYLSYENSICQDYITEKAANPYRYEAIPVILSGANLTRYLPPDSYIDARSLSAPALAARMKFLIDNPEEYNKYFWWKDYYAPTMGAVHSESAFCDLCEKLNSKNLGTKIYDNIVEWWHGTPSNPICE